MRGLVPVVLIVALATGTVVAGELFAKTFRFKPNRTLEVGDELGGGLRLDWVRFDVPEPGEGSLLHRGAAPVRAKVAISNLGDRSASVGIAMALLDDEGRLLAAGNGGTRLFPLRKERQMTYGLTLDSVSREAASATVFKISIETTP